MQNDRDAELVDLLWQTCRAMRRLGREAENDDLAPAERFLLFWIWQGKDGEAGPHRRVSELARLLHLTTPAVTQMVKELERQGYVERQRGRLDRRFVYVTLTERGRSALDAAKARRRAFAAAFLGQLEPGERDQLARILTRLLASAERAPSARPDGQG